jgi:glycogen synthase
MRGKSLTPSSVVVSKVFSASVLIVRNYQPSSIGPMKRTCLSLARTFGAGKWEERAENANDVRRQFGLAVSRGPLFALVARLVHQNGEALVAPLSHSPEK